MNARTTAAGGALAGLALIAGLATAPAAASPAAEVVYIPLGSPEAILIVDPKGDRVVGRIEGLPAVHGLAGTPDGRYLVAGSYDERPAEGPAPAKPAAVSEDEHAQHHVRPPGGVKAPAVLSTVSVVRIADRSVIRRIDVPGAVHHVATSPDGRFAVVTHPNQDRITVIDLSSFAVVATVVTGALPNYAAFSRDGSRVYVSNAGDGTVGEVEAGRWIVRRNFAVGRAPEHIVLSRDGRELFVANVDDGTVSIVAVAGGEVVRTIPVGSVLHGIDLADDGKTLFAAALGDDKVVAVDLESGASRALALSPSPYHLAAVGGSGKLYVSSNEEPKVWIVDAKNLSLLGEIAIEGKGHQMVQWPGR